MGTTGVEKQKQWLSKKAATVSESPKAKEVWKPLSFNEKSMLRVRKTMREIEQLKQAQRAGKVKLEKLQLDKIGRWHQLEKELWEFQRCSAAEGGRTFVELEAAMKSRKEEVDRAVVAIQKSVRGSQVPEAATAEELGNTLSSLEKDI